MPFLLRLFICIAIAAPLAIAMTATASAQVTAQAGSTGGSLGKKGKSASGGEEASPRQTKPRSKASASAKTDSSKSCGNFNGTWTSGGGSWLYGANDTVFRSNGTARHSSGIVGTWTCEDGVIDLDWKNWDHDRLKLSADGKRLDSLAGGRGFTR